jgi:hypothetical protein
MIKRKQPYTPLINRNLALLLARETLAGDYTILEILSRLPNQKKGSWGDYARILLAWIQSGFIGKPPFVIFAKGNSKLPFFSFSSLPVIECPGAGECVNFCYSLRAWQYPAAFMRQLQNSLLMRNAPELIQSAFFSLPSGILRLYVDGDFSSVKDVIFWMELIASRPDVSAYGYSKSWVELLGAHLKGVQWPANYLLNLSSGSRHPSNLKNLVSQLPIVRGEFIAVPVASAHIHNQAYHGPSNPGFPAYQKAVIASARVSGIARVFVCKGKCGECLPDGSHACGSVRMKDVVIAIGVH